MGGSLDSSPRMALGTYSSIIVGSVLSALVFISCHSAVANVPEVFFLESCYGMKDSIMPPPVNGILVVKLHRHPMLYTSKDYKHCVVKFVAKDGVSKLFLHWDFFDVGYKMFGADRLSVYDSQTQILGRQPFPLGGPLWGILDHNSKDSKDNQPNLPKDYYSLSSGLTLEYKGHPMQDSLVMVLTTFRDLPAGGTTCRAGYMKCKQVPQICIPDYLRCNDWNNCGDNSDEGRECQPYAATTELVPLMGAGTPVGLYGALVGILITMVLFIGVGGLLVYRRRRSGRHSSFDSPSHSLANLTQPRYRTEAKPNEYRPLPVSQARPTGGALIANHGYSQPDLLQQNGVYMEPVDPIEPRHELQPPGPQMNIYSEPTHPASDSQSGDQNIYVNMEDMHSVPSHSSSNGSYIDICERPRHTDQTSPMSDVIT